MTYYDPDPQPPAIFQALLTTETRSIFIPGLYYGPEFDPLIQKLRSRGIRVIMDGNCDPQANLENPHVRRAIASVHLFLPNAREVFQLTSESSLEGGMLSLARLCPQVAVKDGSRGAYACTGEDIIHEPAIRVEAVDTTGAGDCFSAGFTKAWLEGQPLRECLRWGNIVGGLSTLKLGGTGQVVTEREVEEWLKRDL
jgi:sugar/nucleoside kinase (ribokinase family)